MKAIIFVFTCFFAFGQSQLPHLFRCPKTDGMQGFDPTRFSGVWYEIEAINNTFNALSRCARAVFTLETEAAMSMTYLQTAFVWDLSNEGPILMSDRSKGEMTWHLNNALYVPLKVMATDYDTWAVVYSCQEFVAFHFEFAWIYSRRRPVSNENLSAAYKAFDKFVPFNRTQLNPVNQWLCFY